MHPKFEKGVTLIETLIGMGLLVFFSLGIYTGFNTLLQSSLRARQANVASDLLNERAEFIRNLPYSSVGVVGGVPAGTLSSQEQYTRNGETFVIKNTVKNIDDPYDGVAGGTPNDTAPADYKLVELDVSCLTCAAQVASTLVMRVAPKNLETNTENGSLFVNVFDANGIPISGATVTVLDNQANPAININDVTDPNGVYQLVDTPTGTQAYQVTVSKNGYSSDRTYTPGNPANPNPVKPDATVISQELTSISFAIDRLAVLNLRTANSACQPLGNVGYALSGAKLIGVNPDVKKYSATSTTDANGLASTSLEWDTYNLSGNDSRYYLSGILPYGNLVINPNAAVSRKMILKNAAANGLLVDVIDGSNGNPLADAYVTASSSDGAAIQSATTSYETLGESNWAGNYSATDGSIALTASGTLVLSKDGLGRYPTSTSHWLMSTTKDLGDPTNSATAIDWNAVTPAGTNVKFQIAVNNDNATWNFAGPDGTDSSYYTATTTLGALLANNRYFMYKVFLTTTDQGATPELDSFTLTFKGGCVPANEILFSGLPAGTYTVTASRSGYNTYQATTTVSVGYQKMTISL